MKEKIKRTLAAFTAALMLLCMMPSGIFAEAENLASDVEILGVSQTSPSAGEAADKLFDGNRQSSKWCVEGNTGWVVFKTAAAVKLEKIIAYHAGQSSNPWDSSSAGNTKAYALQAFNGTDVPAEGDFSDDGKWTTIGEETNNTEPTKETFVSMTEAAQYFRLNVTDSGDPNTEKAIRFYELELFGEAPAPTAVNVSPVTVVMGNTVPVSVTVEPEGASTSFTYEIADTSIATVSADGKITGVAVGETTLTVTSTKDANISGTAAVNVLSDVPTKITVSEMTVKQGETLPAVVTVEPEGASTSFTYAIADTSIATVNDDGEVTGVAVGETTLTVTSTKDTSVFGTANITVEPDPTMPTSVTVEDITVAEGDYVSVSLKMEPASAESDFTYTIEGTAAEMDDEIGVLVHGKTAGQTATLTVVSKKNPNVTDTATVTVTENPLNAALNIENGTLKFGACDFREEDIYPWTAVTEHGRLCAKSANRHIPDSIAALEVPAGFTEAKAFNFDYMVSSEQGCDGIIVLASNGESFTDISDLFSGNKADKWYSCSCLVPANTESLIILYGQDDDWFKYDDTAWIDNLRFEAPVPVESITVDPAEITIPVMNFSSERDILFASVLPENATIGNNSITWTSSDENIVEVSSSGRIRGISVGTATVTAEINGIQGSCTVTVVAKEDFPTQIDDLTFISMDPLPYVNTNVALGAHTDSTPVMVPQESEESQPPLRYAYVKGWSCTAQAGDKIRFYSAPVSGYTDTYMTLLDAEFNVLDTDDDGGEGACSEIIYEFAEAGTYYIVLRQYNNYRRGVVEMHAHILKPVTVTFNPGEGSTVDPASVMTDEDGQLSSLPVPVNPNPDYEFIGWYTAIDGGERITEYTVFEADTAVYAHWRSPHLMGTGYHEVWRQSFEPDASALDEDGDLIDRNWLPAGWTAVDKDGNGESWFLEPDYSEPGAPMTHHGKFGIVSLSFDDTPDNWLISPEFTAENGSKLTFCLVSPGESRDELGVYVIENGAEPVQLGEDIVPRTAEWQEYCFDLSAYAGKTIQVAFVHHNVCDCFLNLDCVYLWALNQYTITFDANGGEGNMENQLFTYDAEQALTANSFVRTGYTFNGWNTSADGSGTAYADKQNVINLTAENNAEITLYAQWTVNQYTITYNVNSEFYAEQTYDYGSQVTAPDYTVPEGHTFSGWNTPETMPAEDIILNAELTVNQYTITFDSNGGEGNMENQLFTYDAEQALTANSFVRTGYTFNGWNTSADGSGTAYADKQNVINLTAENNAEITLYAQWTVNQYTITYNVNGEFYAVQTYDYGAQVTAPDYTVPEGHTFSGWNTPETMPAEDITLNAELTVNQYTISFDSNGGSAVDPITQDYGTEVAAPEDPIKEGYTFAGWYESKNFAGDAYEFTTMPAQNITLYAKWTINQYTITFDANGGSEVAPITQDYGTIVTAPEEPAKEGYTFNGWYTDNGTFANEYEFTTMPAQDITLYAKWTVNQYTITFDSNGGSAVDPITQDYGTIVTAPVDPVKEGYTFNGWYTDNGTFANEYEFTTMPAQDITLYAQWTVNQYTITYNVNGEFYAVQTYDYGSQVTVPDYTVPEGHTFSGWNTPETMPAEDITLNAELTINQYTISFDSNGGSEVDPITQDYGTIVTAPDDPTNGSCIFDGWYLDNGTFEQPYTFTTMPAQDITLYAKWRDFIVTFCDWNGAPIETQEIPLDGTATAPEPPVHEGYEFIGWSEDFGSVQQDMTVIALYKLIPATDPDIIFRTNTVYTKPDTDVKIDFSVEALRPYECHAFTGFLYYEPSELTLVNNELIKGEVWQQIEELGGFVAVDTTVPGKIGLTVIMPNAGFDMSGTIFSMNFHAENYHDWQGYTSPLFIEIAECSNHPVGGAGTPIVYDIVNGSVNIYDMLFGDVNWDGKIDTTDVILIMRYALGVQNLTGKYLAAADFNHDGIVNATDALLLMRYIINQES